MTSTPWRLLSAALVTGFLGCASAGHPPEAAADRSGAELAAVLDAVQGAIAEAETRDVPGFPPLKKVVLKLQTTVSRSASGEVRYLVASIGSSVSAETVSVLELEWAPPAAPRHMTAIPEQSLKDALAQAIHLAKSGIAHASHGNPPLALKGVSIDLKFEVSTTGTADASVKILPVGLSGTGAVSRTTVHAVALTFSS